MADQIQNIPAGSGAKNARDFDFDLPTTQPLTGYVLVPRAASDVTAFKGRRLCAKGAWLHLYEIANTEAGTTMLRGIPVHYEPGWVLWSVKKLAETWQWDRETVSKFLVALEKAGWIEFRDATQYGRVIVLVDYQPATTAVCHTETRSGLHTGLHTEGDGVEKEMGRDPAPEVLGEDLESELLRHAAAYPGDPARGIPAGLPEGWVLAWLNFQTRSARERGVAFAPDLPHDLYRSARADWARGKLRPADWKKNGANNAPAATLPAWKEAKQLQDAIRLHPANPDGPEFVGFRQITDPQRAQLAALRARFAELESIAV
jgi:hypothetical protein